MNVVFRHIDAYTATAILRNLDAMGKAAKNPQLLSDSQQSA